MAAEWLPTAWQHAHTAWQYIWNADWPNWISAASNVALVAIALTGYRVWKRQMIANRNHDVAIRLMNAITKCYMVLHEVRTDGPLLTDDEVRIDPTGLSNEQYNHQVVRERYRTRLRRLTLASEERFAVMTEMLETIGDAEVGDMVNELSNLEASVKREASKHLGRLHPDPHQEGPAPDLDILFSPYGDAPDSFEDDYQGIIERIRKALGPYIRMEQPKATA